MAPVQGVAIVQDHEIWEAKCLTCHTVFERPNGVPRLPGATPEGHKKEFPDHDVWGRHTTLFFYEAVEGD